MICLLGLFLMASAAMAQPVEGPWEVWQIDNGREIFQTDLIEVSQDTITIFYTDRFDYGDYRLYAASWLMQSHTLLSDPDTLRSSPGWRYGINDAMPLEGGTWMCAVTADSGYWYGSGQNEAFVMHGTSENVILNQRTIYTGWTGPIGFCWGDCSAMTNCHLSPRAGGGFLLSAAVSHFFDIPTREFDAFPYIFGFGEPDAEPDWQMTLWISTLFGCLDNYVVSLSPDTSLLLAEGAIWPDVFIGRVCPQCDPEENPPIEMECAPDVREFMRTESGRTLLLSGNELGAAVQVYELNEAGACSLLYEASALNDLSASASNPLYGFAALFIGPSSLMLARIDTNGHQVQSIGTFFWRDDEHAMVAGSLTIADDGRVIVLWSERDEGSANATRLRIGSVGWDTPLNKGDSGFILPPSSFILSAYPNPFNSAVSIRYDLPSAVDVSVSIFNLLGEKIAVLQNGRQIAGAHSVTWAPEVGSGIYFVRMAAGSTREMRKIVYLK